MDESTREFVRNRSNGRCEYCGNPQQFFTQLFHIEHIVAASHGGTDETDNLALACRRCNMHKGPNLSGIDPATGNLTRLFNPRVDVWGDHFETLPTGEIAGRTDVGRTIVSVLDMNADRRVELRRAIAALENQ